MRLTIRKGQRWRSKTPPHHEVVVRAKDKRGGWRVVKDNGEVHSTTQFTLNRYYQLV